jgi:hypothetical protein
MLATYRILKRLARARALPARIVMTLAPGFVVTVRRLRVEINDGKNIEWHRICPTIYASRRRTRQSDCDPS